MGHGNLGCAVVLRVAAQTMCGQPSHPSPSYKEADVSTDVAVSPLRLALNWRLKSDVAGPSLARTCRE